jgi:hypothetical protein
MILLGNRQYGVIAAVETEATRQDVCGALSPPCHDLSAGVACQRNFTCSFHTPSGVCDGI